MMINLELSMMSQTIERSKIASLYFNRGFTGWGRQEVHHPEIPPRLIAAMTISQTACLQTSGWISSHWVAPFSIIIY